MQHPVKAGDRDRHAGVVGMVAQELVLAVDHAPKAVKASDQVLLRGLLGDQQQVRVRRVEHVLGRP